MSIKSGDRAPDFTLPAHQGGDLTLKGLVSKGPVVLYFYPMDNTPGCSAEARSFRDAYEEIRQAGGEVIGVSSQSPQSHQGFAREQCLPFTLLSDTDGKVRELYGVPKGFGFLPGRSTYLIDRDGIVRHVTHSQLRISRHIQEALETLKSLNR